MTRRIVRIRRLVLALILASVAGFGLVLTSLPASSDYLNQPAFPVYLPLALKAWNPESVTVTSTPTPTATATPTATPTSTPTPTATPAGAVVVTSSSAFTQTVGSRTMVYVVGEVSNAASSPLESVAVMATFYSASGTPVASAQTSAYRPLLGPGQTSPFKIGTDMPPDYAYYTLEATYAFSSRPPLAELPVFHASNYSDQLSGWRYLFGEVQNTMKTPIAQVMVIGTFFDGAGKVVNVEAVSPFHEVLEPGDASPFRLVLSLGPTAYASPPSWTVVYAPAQGPAYHGLSLLSRSHVRDSWEVEGENGSVIVLHSLDIFGEFQNDSGGPVHKVRLIGTFYDKAGNVINASSTHYPIGLRHILAPSERAPFHLRLDTGPMPQDDDRWVFDVVYEPATTQPLPRVPILSSTTYQEQRAEQQGDDTVVVRWVDIVGEIGNDTAASLKSARVIGTFYDDQNTVINVAAASVYRRIVPTGEQSPFKLPVSFGPLNWASSGLTVDYATSSETPIPGLEIINDRAEQGGTLRILGELRNSGTQTLHAPRVVATLYDEAGGVINVERLRLGDQVDPDETVPFALEFAAHFDGWDRYELYAEGMY